ncbi:hypothetical protein [Actinoplanes sp. CA-252034]|uniref:hypothetical protein n=1 Tax=Actinoplanes sp. CA-252034 TaxID=3239906 RepID=UPI003D96040B
MRSVLAKRVTALAGALVLLFLVLTVCMLGLNGGDVAGAASFAGGFVAFIAVGAALSLIILRRTTYRRPALWRASLVAVWSVGLAFAVVAMLRVWLGPPVWVLALCGAVAVIGGALVYRRTTARELEALHFGEQMIEPWSTREAVAMVAVARRTVARADPTGDRNVVARLNLARALMWLSMLDRSAGTMAEARRIVDGVLATPHARPHVLLGATMDLMSTVDSYAKLTGDGSDYPTVLRLFRDVAAGNADARPKLYEYEADYAFFQAEEALATARDDADRRSVVAHLQRSAQGLHAAASVSTAPVFRLVVRSKAAMVDALLTDIDQGLHGRAPAALARFEECERVCREALREIPGRDQNRIFAGAGLIACQLTTARWQMAGGPAERRAAGTRLDEAERLCRRLLRRRTDMRPALMQRLTEILALRAELG